MGSHRVGHDWSDLAAAAAAAAFYWASQVELMVENLPANSRDKRRHQFDAWVRKIPWRRAWQSTLVFFPGKSHGQRRLAGYNPWGRKRFGHDSALNWRRQWQPTPVLLPGKSHGWRRLVGCSPWVYEESDRTEWLHFHFSLSCIGEGNGNPLQCSCLENPRDSGTWWAAVYGVAQSQTRLKWLSSSSISSILKSIGINEVF